MRGRLPPCQRAAAATAPIVAVARAAAVAVAAACALLVAAAAPPAPVISFIPFPSPPGGASPGGGRLHTLPALQCRLHPSTPGGASPDPAAVVNPYGRGGTGWVLAANGTAEVVIPYGAGTCAAPLDDAAELEFLAAPDQVAAEWFIRVDPTVPRGGDAGAEFEWAGNGIQARINFAALAGDKGADGFAAGDYFRPQPCAAAAGRQRGLVCADEVVRLLTAQRNQRVGIVQRHRGLFDVLGVSRISTGVVLDTGGLVVAAQDRVSDASGEDGLAVVTYKTRDNRTRPVLIGEAALLSLGRGLLADPSWLGAPFPGGMSASVKHSARGRNQELWSAVWPLSHALNATNATSSPWLPNIASILCQPPAASFVVDSSLCDGVVEPQPPRRNTLRAGGRPVADTLGELGEQHPRRTDVAAIWSFQAPKRAMSAPACPSFANLTLTTAQLRQPVWLLGRGNRELHTAGPGDVSTEVTLARRLSSCAYNHTRWDLESSRGLTHDIVDLTAELSQRYRRDLFRADPPAAPATNAGLFLAVLVVVPESVAVLLLLLQPHGPPHRGGRWVWRNGLALALVLAAGAAALIVVGYVDREEQLGHEWRAAAVRVSTRIAVNTTEQKYVAYTAVDYRGRLAKHTESLIIVAATGYRPHVTRWILIGCVVAYGLLTMTVLVQAAVATRLSRRRPDGDDGSSAVGVTPDLTWAGLRRRTLAAAPVAMWEADLVSDDDNGSDGGGGGGGGRGSFKGPGVGHWSLAV